MFGALLLGALVDTIGVGGRPVACTFPGRTIEETSIEVVMTPKPSLKDLPGLYRVEMDVNGAFTLTAAAQPIRATDIQDVIVRGTRGDHTHFTLGFDANGQAALNIMVDDGPDQSPREATRAGQCRNYERAIQRWSIS